MLDIALYCTGRTPHLSMPVTGLLMLQEQGRVRLSWEVDRANRNHFPDLPLLGVYARDRKILFDMSDGYGRKLEKLTKAVEQSDDYFRRSFSRDRNRELDPKLQKRMHPLGFHYHVSYPGNFMDDAVSFRDWRNTLFQIVFNGKARHYFTPDRFEREPRKGEPLTVMFYTRLWDPEAAPPLHDAIVRMNRDRIALVSALQKQYGSRFVGGIQYSRLAMKSCRELVADIRATKRVHYLDVMHQADICVGSTGLHGSIGWKTGEYIAASKAIVSEKMQYEVTGDFRNGVHYLEFDSPEICVEQVERLMADPERVFAMKQANRTYYQQYLRPDRLMANALMQVFPDLDGGETDNGD